MLQAEDRDSCRICKNAVYQGRNKKVETKMIRCSECGKIGKLCYDSVFVSGSNALFASGSDIVFLFLAEAIYYQI